MRLLQTGWFESGKKGKKIRPPGCPRAGESTEMGAALRPESLLCTHATPRLMLNTGEQLHLLEICSTFFFWGTGGLAASVSLGSQYTHEYTCTFSEQFKLGSR